MKSSRRQFLKYAAGSGIALGLGAVPLLGRDRLRGSHGSLLESKLPGSGNPLRFPPAYSGTTLTAAVTQQSVFSGAPTEVWTFNESYPAPTIRVRRGDTFSTRLINNLPDETIIHWHGLVVPHEMDGHPRNAIAPGASFDYSFKINQRAGTYWYHPHPHMMTGPQVYKGMAGLFIVDDDEQDALDLPRGEFDLPLIIQDRRAEHIPSFTYTLSNDDVQNGYLGDMILVNGTPDPYLEVGRGLYRFRILNGSNARILDLALSDNSPFHIIGTDGGLIDRPYEVSYMFLGPAERIEILIDFSRYAAGTSVLLKSLPFGGSEGYVQGTELPVLRFDIIDKAASPASMPATLTTIEKLDEDQAKAYRKFTFRIDHSVTPNAHPINDLEFDMERIDERVKLGDLEIWTFENISFLPHPMHLHGAQFQLLTRSTGGEIEARDRGWKDTIYVRPFETVRVIVRFNPAPGLFLVHCHNLEHEDHGMMLNYEVVEDKSAVETQTRLPDRLDLW